MDETMKTVPHLRTLPGMLIRLSDAQQGVARA